MSVIIRLQNLPWSANALDIRQYFHGLSIPEGGVHIVGGELGDAFIAFSTDEDARQAFQRNNGKIKEVQITLHLSSRTEMQKVIEAARSIQTPFMTQPVVAKPAIVPPVATITPNISTDNKKDDQLSDSSSKKDAERSKNRNRRRSRSRSRSRERERTRDRSRDRSRDRRDRRRRDRSRSRDRNGRRRDRSDRRDRSKSRERTRSRDRDSRRSRENKPRTRSSERNEDSNHSGYSNSNDQKRINPWESNKGPQRQGSGMNNGNNTQNNQGVHPMMNQLEEARRSLNLIAGMQNQPPALQTNQTSLINQQERRNPMLQNWIENNKREGSNPLPDRPVLDPSKQSLSAMFQQVQQQRPILNNRSMGMFQTQSNLGPRPNFNQESGNNFRPFMNRTMAEIMSQNQNQRNSPDYTKNSDDYRRDRDRDRNDYRKDRDESPPRRHTSRNEIEEHCVQLRPYWGGYGDLRRFFHGLFISNTGIKVLRESDGKRNGIIYIKFVRPESRQVALSKNGMKLKGFQVEISEISNADFDNYGSEDRRDEEAEDEVEIIGEKRPFTCLVVEDIPSFAKEHDMLKMFSDYSLLGIDIQSQNRKRYAYIQFNKEDDAQKALEETGKHILGGKQLVVKACPEKNLQNPGEFRPQQQQQPPPQQQQKQQQQPKPDPKPLILEPPIEVDSPLQIKEDQPEVEPPQELLEDSNDRMDQMEPPYGNDDVIFLSGMPPKTTDRDVIDFFSDIGIVPTNVHMVNTKFGPTGECYCEFGTPDEVVSALDKNGQPLGNNIINVESFPRRDMDEHLGLQSGPPQFPPFPNRFPNRLGPMGMGPGPRPMGPMGFPRHPGPKPMMNPRFDNMVPHDPNLLPPGCVVEMRNVPYKAGIDEILQFFRNYDIHHQSVMRRYNDSGHPTGDARVTFNSPHEAKMAFEECKFKKIRDRTIFLNVL